MNGPIDRVTAVTIVIALACATAISLRAAAERGPDGQGGRAGSASGPVSKPGAPPAQATGFVGDETCGACHDAEAKSIHDTLHGKVANLRTPAGTGRTCETCHGPDTPRFA